MFAATLLTADREDCRADTVCKDHETRRRERRQERKRQEDVRQTVTLIACVCVLYKISVLQHEPTDRLLCVVGIGVEPYFDYLQGNNNKGKIAGMKHRALSLSPATAC